jgi:hypothetical protein
MTTGGRLDGQRGGSANFIGGDILRRGDAEVSVRAEPHPTNPRHPALGDVMGGAAAPW